MVEIVRVLRLLEYVGPRKWVEETMKNNAVKGEHRISSFGVIREAILGGFPELLYTLKGADNDQEETT